MIFEHAHLRIAEQDRATFEKAAPAARDILLAAQGCSDVHISASVDEPGLYLLRVGWDSIEDHLERFPDSDQGAALGALIGGLFAEAPAVTHFHDTDLTS